MQEIAIMNDCDRLDVRDFDAVRQPWEEAGIPIDWSFHIFGKLWKNNDDFQPFDIREPIVRQCVTDGFLRTIHFSLKGVLRYVDPAFFLRIINQIKEPIFSCHGLSKHNTEDLLNKFLENYENKFYAIFRGRVNRLNEDTQINFGVRFKSLSILRSNIETLERQIEATNGRDAILSTHLGLDYARTHHNKYLKQVDTIAKMMKRFDIKVVEVRQLIKKLRVENG